MSDTILSGRWIVYYLADNRQKRITRDTSVTPTVTDSVNAVYSAAQNLMDEVTTMDDGTIMSAQTPSAYTIGIIDAGDLDPWYIDEESTEYLTGGAITTTSWARVTSSNVGIVRFDYTVGAGTDFVTGDIGTTVSSAANGCSGTLLDFVSDGSNGTAWVRPDTDTAADDWDNSPAATDVQSTGTGTGLSQDAAATTGEHEWTNLYNVTPVPADTHVFVNQRADGTTEGLVTNYKDSTQDWWDDGEFDILVKTKEDGALIDGGFVTVAVRHHTDTYSYFVIDLSAGGRNPIPLSPAADSNNTLGYSSITTSSITSDTYAVGDEIVGGTSGARAIITAISGTNPTYTFEYYLIGDPLTDFQTATETVDGVSPATGTGSKNGSAVTSVNAATWTDVTVTHATNEGTYDVDKDDTNEAYSVVIDCGSRTSLAQVYQRTQYITRRGETSTGSTDGQQGQFYIGADYLCSYSSITGTVNEGDVVTGDTSGATATIVAIHTTAQIVVLRNTRGTISATEDLEETVATNYITLTSATAVAPNAASPFGTFAGGTWFLAQGCVLANIPAGENNNYVVVADDGVTYQEPTSVSVTIGNTRALDKVAVYRLATAGAAIEKDYYAISGTPAAGASTFSVSPAIRVDEPDKAAGGVVFVVDNTEGVEHRYRWTSWSGSAFTLFSVASVTADAGGSATSLIDASVDFTSNGTLIGDIVRNTTEGTYAYVTAVANGSLTTTNTGSNKPVVDWSSDAYDIGLLQEAYTSADDVYVPIIHTHETTGTDGSPGSEVVNVVFDATMEVRIRARQGGDILPYEADAQITSSGLSNNVIRTADTIHT